MIYYLYNLSKENLTDMKIQVIIKTTVNKKEKKIAARRAARG